MLQQTQIDLGSKFCRFKMGNKTNNTNGNGNGQAQVKTSEYPIVMTRLLIGGLCLSIAYLCLTNQLRLFTLHPILASAWFLLMTEGLLVMRVNNPLTKGLSYRTKIKYHWILQVAGLSCGVSTFIVVNIHKNIDQSVNEEPLHGLFGFSSLTLCILTCLGGVSILYDVTFGGFLKLSLIKFAHKTNGCVTYGIHSLAVLTSLYTLWFRSNASGFIIIICTSIVLIVMLYVLSQYIHRIVKRIFPKSK